MENRPRSRSSGPGKYLIKIGSDGVARAWLFNFDIGGAALKPGHTSLLDTAIGPLLRDGGSVKLLGLASTTGQTLSDQRLGEHRAQTVLGYLHQKFGKKFNVVKVISFGKEMALAFNKAHLKGGTGDNQESELWRAVVINAWNRNDPIPPASDVEVPFDNPTWADSTGKVVNVLDWSLSILDWVADLGELTSLAEVTGPLGLIGGVIDAIVTMPLLWASTDALANTNGQIQGGADAIQDMADEYSDDKLDRTPLSKWPAVRVPEPHLPENPQPTASQQAWRAGQVTGLKNAVKVVLDLEQNPKSVTLEDGQHIRVSGRLWLRAISKKFQDNAGVETVIKPANEELKKRGKKPFPTF
jgi:hypothetical protein